MNWNKKKEVGNIYLDFFHSAWVNKIDAVLQVTGVLTEKNVSVKNDLTENLTVSMCKEVK